MNIKDLWCKVTVQDIYGGIIPPCPIGKRFTGDFRFPVSGECFLGVSGSAMVCGINPPTEPRLILTSSDTITLVMLTHHAQLAPGEIGFDPDTGRMESWSPVSTRIWPVVYKNKE